MWAPGSVRMIFLSDQWPWQLINQWRKRGKHTKHTKTQTWQNKHKRLWQETNLMIIGYLETTGQQFQLDQLGLCNWQDFKSERPQIWGNGDSVEMYRPMGYMQRGTKRPQLEKGIEGAGCVQNRASQCICLTEHCTWSPVCPTNLHLLNKGFLSHISA